jgi:MHS family alpha-ketoglutarate permease-like MFS transporter
MPMPAIADAPKPRLNQFGSIIGGSIGNLVEWYDWYAYSVFSLYFAATFFPGNNQTAQLLSTAGIFAIGFLMRPIGGWFMGAYADRKGRKSALTLSVIMMCGGSLLIAVVPGYAQIGIAAPLLLVFARMVQGFSIGGEYGTVATYLGELAPKKLRGFYSSFMYITGVMGQLIALTLLILMQRCFLSPAQLSAWGWRIPFVLGAVLGLFAFYLRRNLLETTSFNKETKAEQQRGTFKELLKYKRESLTVIGFTIGGTVAYYIFTNYIQKFLVNSAGFSKNDSTLITIIVLVVFMFAQPLAGLLGDKYSRKTIMIIYSVLSLVTTIPILALITHNHQFWVATALIIAALLIQSLNTSISGIIKAELFPASVRSLGVSFPYAITVALFGGTAEYIALWFKKIGHEPYFYWYLTFCIFITLIASIAMRDTSKYSKLDEK